MGNYKVNRNDKLHIIISYSNLHHTRVCSPGLHQFVSFIILRMLMLLIPIFCDQARPHTGLSWLTFNPHVSLTPSQVLHRLQVAHGQVVLLGVIYWSCAQHTRTCFVLHRGRRVSLNLGKNGTGKANARAR
ncbi:hypothetical protein ACLB2K_026476 [Fragaria x ananassa]